MYKNVFVFLFCVAVTLLNALIGNCFFVVLIGFSRHAVTSVANIDTVILPLRIPVPFILMSCLYAVSKFFKENVNGNGRGSFASS